MNNNIVNSLTIDVEDYFQVSNFRKIIKSSDWDKYKCRIDRNILCILDILREFNVKGTFFVLGWIAERYPKLIKKIHQEGHEIASHGYYHKLISLQTREEFREDTRKTKCLLEDIIGDNVIGYRAPSFSITQNFVWVLEILIEEGFKYDSSILPIYCRSRMPYIPRFPFIIKNNSSGILNKSNIFILPINQRSQNFTINNSFFTKDKFIIEFPVSTVKILANNFPISGGGYFRLFPYQFTKWGLKSINRKERRPFIFYIHPWEFDKDQPRIKDASNLSKFRHYINLDKTEDKMRKLLADFKFFTVKEVLGIQQQHNDLRTKMWH